MKKIPVYFMPGLAANSKIFEKIQLDNDKFECFYLEWLEPFKNESLIDYCKRLIKNIKHDNPVLIGVSFGGIVVQEIAKLIPVQQVVLISSVKSETEFPKSFDFARRLKLFKIFPTGKVNSLLDLTKKIVYSKKIKHRLDMYEKYITVRSENYLDWGIKNVLNWKNDNISKNIIHIHGTKDHIFPSKNIKDAIFLENATHVLVLLQYKWLNKNLSNLILNKIYEAKMD